jgi:hypothetical protein
MNDKRIGNTSDGTEPEVCAVSGLAVQGWHNVQHMLGGAGHFCRVRATRDHLWSEALETELLGLISENAPKSYPVMPETPTIEPPFSKRLKPTIGDSDVRSE